MLVHFPIACWTLGNLADALALAGVRGAWPHAWLALVIGCGAALPAALAGLLDIAKLDDAAAKTASMHMLLMVSALTAYAAAVLTRSDGWRTATEPGLVPLLLSGIGFALMVGGGHFGAALVYRHGAGRTPQNRMGE